MAKIYGLELKGIKHMTGRNGVIFQGNIYLSGKKIGVYSQDLIGGAPSIWMDSEYSECKLEKLVKEQYFHKDNIWKAKEEMLEYINVVEETFENIYTLKEWEKVYGKELKKRKSSFVMIVVPYDYQYRMYFSANLMDDSEIKKLCCNILDDLGESERKTFIFRSMDDFNYGHSIKLNDIKF